MPQRVCYQVATSLDGFIAPPDESTSWIVDDPTIDFPALYTSFSAFAMGRKTYEAVTAESNPLAGLPKENVIVFSRTMDPTTHPDITVVRGHCTDHVRRLRQQDGKGVWLMGGGWLAGACLEEGVLDAVEVAIMPVVLGRGYNVLEGLGKTARKLILRDVKTLEGSGIVMVAYDV